MVSKFITFLVLHVNECICAMALLTRLSQHLQSVQRGPIFQSNNQFKWKAQISHTNMHTSLAYVHQPRDGFREIRSIWAFTTVSCSFWRHFPVQIKLYSVFHCFFAHPFRQNELDFARKKCIDPAGSCPPNEWTKSEHKNVWQLKFSTIVVHFVIHANSNESQNSSLNFLSYPTHAYECLDACMLIGMKAKKEETFIYA